MDKMAFNTLDKKEFRKLFPKTSNVILAQKYNVKESTIRSWGAKLGLIKKNWMWSRHDENFLLKNYGKKRYTIEEICNKIGRTRWSVINKYREITGKR